MYVCMYVCMRVCVYVCDMKFSTNDLTDICAVRFSRILKFLNDDVMAAIFAFFRWGTLTVAILLRFSSKLVGR